MADGRANVRNHVHAAREWLGRAEDSLEREQDIRGDLNLMLAQAELIRAKEAERPTAGRRLARQLLPALAATMVAGGGWLVWRGFTSAEDAPAAFPTGTEAMEAAVPAAIAKATEEVLAAEPVPSAPPIPAAPAAPTEPRVPEEPARPTVTAPERSIEPAPKKAQAAKVPTEAMQKLMGSAGKKLREP